MLGQVPLPPEAAPQRPPTEHGFRRVRKSASDGGLVRRPSTRGLLPPAEYRPSTSTRGPGQKLPPISGRSFKEAPSAQGFKEPSATSSLWGSKEARGETHVAPPKEPSATYGDWRAETQQGFGPERWGRAAKGPTGSSKQPAKGDRDARTLSWSMEVEHSQVKFIKVQVVTTVVQAGPKNFKAHPRCGIRVWAVGPDEEVVARSNASILGAKRSFSTMHLHWVARLKECAPFAVPGASRSAQRVSVAQALMGLLAAVGNLLGMDRMNLEAEDSGSGKLIDFYDRLGFVKTASKTRIEDLHMEAPICALTRLAPPGWLRGLIPAELDLNSWLWSEVDHSLSSLLTIFSVPRGWSFQVSQPPGAALDVKLLVKESMMEFEVVLKSELGLELSYAKAFAKIKAGVMRLAWLGRTKSQAVHPSIRAERVYATAGPRVARGRGGKDAQGGEVTAAVALLGLLAGLALWADVRQAEAIAYDKGSGRLLRYLHAHGLRGEGGSLPEPSEERPPVMSVSCEELADRCCPLEWREELPRRAQLRMLANII